MKSECLIRGDVSTMNTMTKWATRAGNSEPAMVEIKEYMEGREKELFATEGASSGRPWAPDKESTLAKRKGESDKTLQSSGALMRSLTDGSDENAIREIGPGYLRFGTRLPYAEILRKGFKDGQGNRVPARRPIDWNRRDRYVILKIMGSWISGSSRVGPSVRLRFVK